MNGTYISIEYQLLVSRMHAENILGMSTCTFIHTHPTDLIIHNTYMHRIKSIAANLPVPIDSDCQIKPIRTSIHCTLRNRQWYSPVLISSE